MREMGVRGLLVYCADYQCSHSIAISGDGWPDAVRLSDIEARFVCRACVWVNRNFGERAFRRCSRRPSSTLKYLNANLPSRL
jgi:hypothetical protein